MFDYMIAVIMVVALSYMSYTNMEDVVNKIKAYFT
jgi:hypothetical protein